MNEDPVWDKLVDAIELRCKITDHGTSTKPLEDKPELTETTRYIEFIKDEEKYRIERVERPRVLDRKSLYHKAAGSNVTFENIYDPDDMTKHTNFYIYREGEWQPLDADNFSF